VRYKYYRHNADPRYRLVLREGDKPPSEMKTDLWTHIRDEDEQTVGDQIRAEVRVKGYSLYKFDVKFEEIAANRQP
jgi:hypothetical protein